MSSQIFFTNFKGLNFSIILWKTCQFILSSLIRIWASLFFLEEVSESLSEVQNSIESDGVVYIYGCIDEVACNYNVLATEDDMNCTYSEIGFNCSGNCLSQYIGCDDEWVWFASEKGFILFNWMNQSKW